MYNNCQPSFSGTIGGAAAGVELPSVAQKPTRDPMMGLRQDVQIGGVTLGQWMAIVWDPPTTGSSIGIARALDAPGHEISPTL